MKKQDLIQLKEAISPLPINTKQHLITWLNDSLQADADSLIETSQPVSCCPHCHSEHIIRWGHASGLQRYCCKSPDCGKTFNSLTGSALARLQHHEKWFDYLRCMLDSLTLRESAKRTGIDLKTAFRWRHRFLASASATNINSLSGIIEADETFFPESCKGKRHILHREARKRGGQGDKRKERVPVLIARDRLGHVSDHVPEAFNTEYVHRFLAPIIDKESILCSDGAKWYETFASKHDISHHRLITLDNQRVIGREFHIQNVNSYISRLKGWMSKFHGVGTVYLPNYLAWRRLFETTAVDMKTWLQIALRSNQQPLPT